MESVSYLNPAELHSSPAFSQAVRIPAGHDLIVVGGQNGVDSSGRVISDDLAGQTRQAFRNLQVCLEEAKADLDHVVRWSIMVKDGKPVQEGFAAFVEVWGQRPNPSALSSLWSVASQFQAHCARSRR